MCVPGGPLGWREYSAQRCSHCLFHNHHVVVVLWPKSAVTRVFQMFICKQAFFCPCAPVKKADLQDTNGVSREQFRGHLKILVTICFVLQLGMRVYPNVFLLWKLWFKNWNIHKTFCAPVTTPVK